MRITFPRAVRPSTAACAAAASDKGKRVISGRNSPVAARSKEVERNASHPPGGTMRGPSAQVAVSCREIRSVVAISVGEPDATRRG